VLYTLFKLLDRVFVKLSTIKGVFGFVFVEPVVESPLLPPPQLINKILTTNIKINFKSFKELFVDLPFIYFY
jgi:hypothetical protein